MPSFLSKVFGRKKDDRDSPRSPEGSGRASEASLLDGQFEAVTASAVEFPHVENGRGEDGDGRGKQREAVFNLFKPKSRSSSPEPLPRRAPHLSLHFSTLRGDAVSRALALGVVLEGDDESQVLLPESVIGERRLAPVEALNLIRACSQAIIDQGLETLGVMHPHWYSASPDAQRRLISLFVQSLTHKQPVTTFSPTSLAFLNAFENEITSTRSPHDVAAVLRWGIRHLQHQGSSFGTEDAWYKTFFEGEKSASFPTNAYSTILKPQLPPHHLELLNVLLELISYLAAHAESNGSSGSKLTKLLGLWLLSPQRALMEDDWASFYARWDQAGRMLEHIFLARIREEANGARLPIRLLELVKKYPYYTIPSPHLELLPRPRFSTALFDALLIHVETDIPSAAPTPKHHPFYVIVDAFKAESATEASPLAALWEQIKKAGTDERPASPGGYSGIGRIFTEETIRFLSLAPVEPGKEVLYSPFIKDTPSRRQEFSLGELPLPPFTAISTSPSSNGHGDGTGNSLASGSASPAKLPQSASLLSALPTGKDWKDFSTSGFFEETSTMTPLAATLFSAHIAKQKKEEEEQEHGRFSSKKSSGHKAQASGSSPWRKSTDTAPSAPKTSIDGSQAPPTISEEQVTDDKQLVSRSTAVSLTTIDEAFIDFWHDALEDPVSSSWPPFVICRLKSTIADTEVEGKKIEWLVIERAYKRVSPSPPPTIITGTPSVSASGSGEALSPASTRLSTSGGETKQGKGKAKSPSSPRSFISDLSFGASFKRFSFFSGSSAASSPSSPEGASAGGKGRKGKEVKVGEMGEVLVEEEEDEEKGKDTVKLRVPSPKPKKMVDVIRKSVDLASRRSVDPDPAASRKSVEVVPEDKATTGLDVAAVALVGAAATTATAAAISEAVDTDIMAKDREEVVEPTVNRNGSGAAVGNDVIAAARSTNGSAQGEPPAENGATATGTMREPTVEGYEIVKPLEAKKLPPIPAGAEPTAAVENFEAASVPVAPVKSAPTQQEATAVETQEKVEETVAPEPEAPLVEEIRETPVVPFEEAVVPGSFPVQPEPEATVVSFSAAVVPEAQHQDAAPASVEPPAIITTHKHQPPLVQDTTVHPEAVSAPIEDAVVEMVAVDVAAAEGSLPVVEDPVQVSAETEPEHTGTAATATPATEEIEEADVPPIKTIVTAAAVSALDDAPAPSVEVPVIKEEYEGATELAAVAKDAQPVPEVVPAETVAVAVVASEQEQEPVAEDEAALVPSLVIEEELTIGVASDSQPAEAIIKESVGPGAPAETTAIPPAHEEEVAKADDTVVEPEVASEEVEHPTVAVEDPEATVPAPEVVDEPELPVEVAQSIPVVEKEEDEQRQVPAEQETPDTVPTATSEEDSAVKEGEERTELSVMPVPASLEDEEIYIDVEPPTSGPIDADILSSATGSAIVAEDAVAPVSSEAASPKAPLPQHAVVQPTTLVAVEQANPDEADVTDAPIDTVPPTPQPAPNLVLETLPTGVAPPQASTPPKAIGTENSIAVEHLSFVGEEDITEAEPLEDEEEITAKTEVVNQDAESGLPDESKPERVELDVGVEAPVNGEAEVVVVDSLVEAGAAAPEVPVEAVQDLVATPLAKTMALASSPETDDVVDEEAVSHAEITSETVVEQLQGEPEVVAPQTFAPADIQGAEVSVEEKVSESGRIPAAAAADVSVEDATDPTGLSSTETEPVAQESSDNNLSTGHKPSEAPVPNEEEKLETVPPVVPEVEPNTVEAEDGEHNAAEAPLGEPLAPTTAASEEAPLLPPDLIATHEQLEPAATAEDVIPVAPEAEFVVEQGVTVPDMTNTLTVAPSEVNPQPPTTSEPEPSGGSVPIVETEVAGEPEAYVEIESLAEVTAEPAEEIEPAARAASVEPVLEPETAGEAESSVESGTTTTTTAVDSVPVASSSVATEPAAEAKTAVEDPSNVDAAPLGAESTVVAETELVTEAEPSVEIETGTDAIMEATPAVELSTLPEAEPQGQTITEPESVVADIQIATQEVEPIAEATDTEPVAELETPVQAEASVEAEPVVQSEPSPGVTSAITEDLVIEKEAETVTPAHPVPEAGSVHAIASSPANETLPVDQSEPPAEGEAVVVPEAAKEVELSPSVEPSSASEPQASLPLETLQPEVTQEPQATTTVAVQEIVAKPSAEPTVEIGSSEAAVAETESASEFEASAEPEEVAEAQSSVQSVVVEGVSEPEATTNIESPTEATPTIVSEPDHEAHSTSEAEPTPVIVPSTIEAAAEPTSSTQAVEAAPVIETESLAEAESVVEAEGAVGAEPVVDLKAVEPALVEPVVQANPEAERPAAVDEPVKAVAEAPAAAEELTIEADGAVEGETVSQTQSVSGDAVAEVLEEPVVGNEPVVEQELVESVAEASTVEAEPAVLRAPAVDETPAIEAEVVAEAGPAIGEEPIPQAQREAELAKAEDAPSGAVPVVEAGLSLEAELVPVIEAKPVVQVAVAEAEEAQPVVESEPVVEARAVVVEEPTAETQPAGESKAVTTTEPTPTTESVIEMGPITQAAAPPVEAELVNIPESAVQATLAVDAEAAVAATTEAIVEAEPVVGEAPLLEAETPTTVEADAEPALDIAIELEYQAIPEHEATAQPPVASTESEPDGSATPASPEEPTPAPTEKFEYKAVAEAPVEPEVSSPLADTVQAINEPGVVEDLVANSEIPGAQIPVVDAVAITESAPVLAPAPETALGQNGTSLSDTAPAANFEPETEPGDKGGDASDASPPKPAPTKATQETTVISTTPTDGSTSGGVEAVSKVEDLIPNDPVLEGAGSNGNVKKNRKPRKPKRTNKLR